ncbi:MAG: DUF3618 domain-containing protein [Amaricoccus sp.]
MAELNKDPGVTELEREVDRERGRVSATIDELQSRVSMEGLVDQVVKAVGENGGEVSRNLGRSLRENPLAALLTGVGLAWLMAGSGKPRDYGSDREDGGRGGVRLGRDRLAEPRMPGASGYATGSIRSDYPDREDGTSEGGIRERAADVAGLVGEGVSEAMDGIRERASDLSQAASDGLHRAGDTMRDAGGAVRHGAKAARLGIADTGSDMRDGLDALIEDQPLVIGAIAMALGAAVGGALPRSRIEDRMFGEQSDRAMEAARDLAKEQGSRVQAAAAAVVGEAQDIAAEASEELGAKLPSGEKIVDAAESKVREAASRIREAGAAEGTPEPADRTAG